MAQTITLQLPDDVARRYRHGATVAHKALEEFLVERLEETIPPLADDLPSPLREELQGLDELDTRTLIAVAQERLAVSEQRRYTRLLNKNGRGTLTPHERDLLRELGDKARRLTVRRAHAYLLLKWRGQSIGHVDQLADVA